MDNSEEVDSSKNITKDENLNAKSEKRESKRAEKNAEFPVEKAKIESPIEKIVTNRTNDFDFKNDANTKVEVTKDEKNTIENVIKEELNSEIEKTKEKQNIIEPPKVEAKEKAVVNPKTSIVNEVEVPKTEYNNQNEKEISTAIFTDGNQFCIQISSWKNKAQAEKEVKSLQNKGYNAFVVSAKPKNRNDIWHRVRVGFFDLLKDAIKIQQQIKN
jgi:cell division septation protein DedD